MSVDMWHRFAQVITCMRALVNTLLVNGLFRAMDSLEDIPSEFFGGIVSAKKQQNQHHRLPNLFPTLPALHKFVERFVAPVELNAREGSGSFMWPSCNV
jgi:hypothetical protein